jgi:hypothetical protein
MDLKMMDRVGDRWKKMQGYCSTGQSPQWAVVPVEEEEEEEDILSSHIYFGMKLHPDPARKLSTNLYDIYHSCVYSE